jgi:hypothetical protein
VSCCIGCAPLPHKDICGPANTGDMLAATERSTSGIASRVYTHAFIPCHERISLPENKVNVLLRVLTVDVQIHVRRVLAVKSCASME